MFVHVCVPKSYNHGFRHPGGREDARAFEKLAENQLELREGHSGRGESAREEMR